MEEDMEPTLGEVYRLVMAMEKKLDLVYARQLAAPVCPQPGLCVQLAASQQDAKHRLETVEAERIVPLETKVMDLRLWQSRIGGALALLFVLGAVFGPALRRLLHLE